MQSLADAVSAIPEFKYKDITYRPIELDILALGKFTRWLIERAKAFAAIGVTAEEAERDRALINKAASIGEYDPGSVAFTQAMGTRTGAAKMLALALEPNHPDVTEQQTLEMIDADAMAAADLLGWAAPDPKGSSAPVARGNRGPILSRRSGTGKKVGRKAKSKR